ncbi:MAG: FN3 associated domain-containing protein, partial [Planctomycetota bacterium]
DKETEEGPLHVEFKLDGGGEEIGLFDTDGNTLVDSIVFDDQVADVSYGRSPDASDTWRFMGFPTPEAQNNAGYLGRVADTEFSHDRGFYVDDFNVTIVCDTPGATIRYTIDGSAPTVGHGNGYFVAVPITGTTCLRAVAYKAGYLSSNVDTQTYIFISDVIMQSPNGEAPPGWPSSSVNGQVFEYGMDPYIVSQWGPQLEEALTSIPTMSIVTNLDNLLDPSNDPDIGGIYVNAGGHGIEWERETSLELIYPPNPQGPGFPDLVEVPDGGGGTLWELPPEMRDGFQLNAGLRIRGGYSRSDNNPKHAFRLFFRGIYGESKLRFPLFGDEGVDRFDKVDLRTAQNYSWSYANDGSNTMCREVWARDTQGLTGHPYTRSRYYHLYINGQYWGVFQTQERSEASFGESYLGGDREEWDCVKATGPNASYTIEATDGTLDAWRDLWDLTNLGFTSDENYYRAQGLDPNGVRDPCYPVLLDVDNLIDYMMMVFYDGDRDAPISNFLGNTRTNNWYGIRNRNGGEGFRYFVHDAEHIMSRGLTNRTGPYPCGDQFQYFNPQWLHQQLVANPEYRLRFADHVHKHLFNGDLLTAVKAIERFRARAEQIDMAIIAESARWGSSSLNKNTWQNAINNEINNFFPARTGVVLNQFKAKGWYPNVDAPAFDQHGGQVPSGFGLTMDAPTGTIWYTTDGNDPRLAGEDPTPGTSTTLVVESAVKRVLVPTSDIGDTWRNGQPFDDSGWNDGTIISGKTGGVGYERSSGYEDYITYDVEGNMYGNNSTCYIRIPFTFNGDPNDFDFMTLKIQYDDGFIAYLNDDPNELARRNFNGPPSWNSGADESHSDSEAVIFENIPLSSDHISYLRQGDNILAIHGLNLGITSTDFLISVELVASETNPTGISSSATQYTTPVTLTGSTNVKARVLGGATWSALNEATFAVGPVADNLRITEMMYHPLDTNSPNDPNAEFIELTNIGPET